MTRFGDAARRGTIVLLRLLRSERGIGVWSGRATVSTKYDEYTRFLRYTAAAWRVALQARSVNHREARRRVAHVQIDVIISDDLKDTGDHTLRCAQLCGTLENARFLRVASAHLADL